MGELFFDSCGVAADSLLGTAGAGMAVFNDAMLWERGMILAARRWEPCDGSSSSA